MTLKTAIIVLNQGLVAPQTGEWSLNSNWITNIGNGNLLENGKQQLYKEGIEARQALLRNGTQYGLERFSKLTSKDISVQVLDRADVQIGSTVWIQGMLINSESSTNVTQPTITPPGPPVTSESIAGIAPNSKFEGGTSVAISSNHAKFDPVLNSLGDSCPNIVQEKIKTMDDWRSTIDTTYFESLVQTLNQRIATALKQSSSPNKGDWLKSLQTPYDVADLRDYLVAEEAATGTTTLRLSPEDLSSVHDMASQARYFGQFGSKTVQSAGVSLLLEQIKKDLWETAAKPYRSDAEREIILRTNKGKKLILYAADSAVLANLLLDLRSTSYECKKFSTWPIYSKILSKVSVTSCLEWPPAGAHLKIELYSYQAGISSSGSKPEGVLTKQNHYFSIFYQGTPMIPVSADLRMEPYMMLPDGRLTKWSGETLTEDGQVYFKLDDFENFVKMSSLSYFNSFCGAEWLIGKRVVQTFIGLVFLVVFVVSLIIALGIYVVFLRVKIRNLTDIHEKIEQDHLIRKPSAMSNL